MRIRKGRTLGARPILFNLASLSNLDANDRSLPAAPDWLVTQPDAGDVAAVATQVDSASAGTGAKHGARIHVLAPPIGKAHVEVAEVQRLIDRT